MRREEKLKRKFSLQLSSGYIVTTS